MAPGPFLTKKKTFYNGGQKDQKLNTAVHLLNVTDKLEYDTGRHRSVTLHHQTSREPDLRRLLSRALHARAGGGYQTAADNLPDGLEYEPLLQSYSSNKHTHTNSWAIHF